MQALAFHCVWLDTQSDGSSAVTLSEKYFMAAVVVQANSNTHEALSFFLFKMGRAGLVARVAEVREPAERKRDVLLCRQRALFEVPLEPCSQRNELRS